MSQPSPAIQSAPLSPCDEKKRLLFTTQVTTAARLVVNALVYRVCNLVSCYRILDKVKYGGNVVNGDKGCDFQ